MHYKRVVVVASSGIQRPNCHSSIELGVYLVLVQVLNLETPPKMTSTTPTTFLLLLLILARQTLADLLWCGGAGYDPDQVRCPPSKPQNGIQVEAWRVRAPGLPGLPGLP